MNWLHLSRSLLPRVSFVESSPTKIGKACLIWIGILASFCLPEVLQWLHDNGAHWDLQRLQSVATGEDVKLWLAQQQN